MSEIRNLLTEQPNPASEGIDALPTLEVLRIMNDEDRKVAASVTPELPQIARAVDAIVAAFQNGGRLFYIGAGTSGLGGAGSGVGAGVAKSSAGAGAAGAAAGAGGTGAGLLWRGDSITDCSASGLSATTAAFFERVVLAMWLAS